MRVLELTLLSSLQLRIWHEQTIFRKCVKTVYFTWCCLWWEVLTQIFLLFVTFSGQDHLAQWADNMASTIVIQISQVSVVLLILVCTHVRVDATGDGSCNETCEYTEWALDANCRNLDLVTVPHGCDTSVSMDLRNNQLEAIGSGSFAGYGDLRYLDLEFNLIYDITAGAFSGCVSLQFIYLQFNSLESVDEGAFEGASSLERLFPKSE